MSISPTFRHHLLAVAVGVLITAPLHVAAQANATAAATQQYNLPAQPLNVTAARIAGESGMRISIDADLARGITAAPVRGSLTAEAALQQALVGSGLELIHTASGVLSARRAGPDHISASQGAASMTLQEVLVTAAAEASSVTEGSGSYTTPTITTGTGLSLSMRETPQSVTVFTRQQLDDKGIQSIEDMMLQTTGITVSRGAPERPEYISRGYAITTLLLDGIPMGMDTDFYGGANLAMYDHAEILRGAAGLMIGTGDPSGVLSLSRKRPTGERKISVTTSAGRWNNYRGEVDAGGPLNEAGTLRARAVLAYQDSDTFLSHYGHKRTLLYGTIETDLAPTTVLSVGAVYSDEVNNGSAFYGRPTATDGSFLPVSRSANFTPDWSYWNKRNTRVFADLEHRFDNGWKGKLSAYAMSSDTAALLSSSSPVGTTTNLEMDYAGLTTNPLSHRGFQATANGDFQLLGRKHELILGATYRANSLTRGGLAQKAPYSYIYDYRQWEQVNNAPLPELDSHWGGSTFKTAHGGVYSATRINLEDDLKLIAGGRVDWYESSRNNVVQYRAKHKVTPYAGLVYDLNDTYSLYGSWTRIFQPQSTRSAADQVLDPLLGTNIEVGVKGEFFNGALNTSAAVFRIRQTNLPFSLPLYMCSKGMESCAAPAGEVESKGLELDAAGQLGAGWQLAAGYTYSVARHIRDSDVATAGTLYRSDQPRHLIKLSTTYRLPGSWGNWRVGASARVQNQVFQDDTYAKARIRQGGYTLLDLMAAWQVTPQLDLRVNVNNLLDKHYYESLGTVTSSNGVGVPRNFLVTARYQF